MTPQETSRILAVCTTYDYRKVQEIDVIAWHEAIGDLDFIDARAAVVAHYRESRERIMPADVRAHYRSIRRARVAGIDPESLVGDIDPSDADAYHAAMRMRWNAVLSGASTDEAMALPTGVRSAIERGSR